MARVLLVEDNDVVLRLLEYIFSKEGYDVITARDGETAMAKVSGEKPDILVTDCLLPKLDGFKLLDRVRSAETTGRIPIIMTSAIYRKEHYRQAALEQGADAFMVKPIDPEQMLSKARELLDRSGEGLP